MFGFVQPQHRACGECGASVPVSEEDTHECDRQSWLDYQMFQHRGGVAQLEVELGVWLETPHGRFAVFYAERQRRRVAEETIADVDASGRWPGKVVTEVTPAGPFWEAEPEHQDYLERYRHGYTCHFVRPEWVPTRRTQASAGSAKS